MSSDPRLRRTPLTPGWSLLAPGRQSRPRPLESPARDAAPSRCPFCEGHEGDTEREVFAVRTPHSAPDEPGWTIRVVPNKYPALVPKNDAPVGNDDLYDELPGTGRHEVIVETPVHGRAFARMDQAELHGVLRVYQARLHTLSQEPGVRCVALFRNEGRAAGASQEHAHAQVLALPLIPRRVASELDAAEQYFRTRARCLTCDTIARELREASRLVVESETYAVVASFAPRFPYEVWVLPRRHRHDFSNVTDGELAELASVLRRTLIGLESVLGGPFPYNVILQTAPTAGRSHERSFHWRFEIVPRTTIVSGFELGTGIHIVGQTPERAALALRQAVALA